MRVLHVYKDYAPILGGIENHIRALAEAQARDGHDVRVLVTRRPGQAPVEVLNRVSVDRVTSLGTLASTPLSPALYNRAHGAEADLVHVHSPYPVAEIAMLGTRSTYALTLHADPTRPLQRLVLTAYAPFFRRVVSGAAAVIMTSPRAAERSRWIARDDPRVVIAPLGSDPVRFSPVDADTRASGGPVRLLFAGLLRHYKGVDVLLQALPLIDRPVTLTVAGDGPERATLQQLSARLGLDAFVRFVGRVPDAELPDLYRSHDVFVLPAVSSAEAFGQVLVEAMLSGLPCVTTELGTGTSFVVQDRVTGMVVKPRSVLSLAEVLCDLASDVDLRIRLGAAGRERALELFTTDRMLERVRAGYEQALARKR